MPIIERVVGKSERKGKRSSYKTATHMKNIIKYITQGDKTNDSLMGSVNLLEKQNAYNEFVLTKMTYNKMPESNNDKSKRMLVHFVQSFDPKDKNITPEVAKKIADEFASSIFFKEYQVLYAVHTDANHIHTHYIVNTTNIVDGKAWQQTKQELEAMKNLSDSIAISHGISIIKEQDKDKGSHKENAEFQAEKRGASWKKEIFYLCKEAKESSINMEEFIEKLRNKRVEVKISDSRKDITYILGNKKINSDKLGFPKRKYTPFTKESLAKYFVEKSAKNKNNENIGEIEGMNARNKKESNLKYLQALNDIDKLLSNSQSEGKTLVDEKADNVVSKMFKKEAMKKSKGLER